MRFTNKASVTKRFAPAEGHLRRCSSPTRAVPGVPGRLLGGDGETDGGGRAGAAEAVGRSAMERVNGWWIDVDSSSIINRD